MKKAKVEWFYNEYSKLLMKTAYKITGNVYDAEDVVHMCFEWLQRQPGKLNIGYDLLLKKCKHLAINVKKYNLIYENFVPTSIVLTDPLEFVSHEETATAILNCIHELKRTYRDVMCMYIIDRLKTREIARSLNMKTDTVRKKLLRGRRALEKMLIKKGLM